VADMDGVTVVDDPSPVDGLTVMDDVTVVFEEPQGAADAAGFEASFAAAQQAADAAAKAAAAVSRDVRNAAAKARTGQVRDLRRAIASAQASLAALSERVGTLSASFDLDEQALMAKGAYTAELLAAAQARGLAVFEEEDRLLCYPSLLRILPGDAAVEIDRVRERRIRPSVLVEALAATQESAPRFKADAFLDSLRAGYELVVAGEQKRPDAVVRLVDIWSVLTLLPGQRGQYSKQEFARDLYLLDQSGVTRTARNPRQVRWCASTGTKGSGLLVTVARSGQRQYYWGIAFTLGDEEG